MKILEQKPNDLLKEFLSDYCTVFNVDYNESVSMINDNFKFYNGTGTHSVSSEIERRWYEQLLNGVADYSVYDEDYYYVDLWCCWKMYSRNYLKIINAKGTLVHYFLDKSIAELLYDNSKSVVDLGCGIGYSTAGLKQIFPHCSVYGFNIEGTKQYKFCKYISEKYDFDVIGSLQDVSNIDIAFASEYFEHFERPMEHLDTIVSAIRPKYLIIANSFNTKSIGHFVDYKNKDEVINQKDISRSFNKHILSIGYEKVKTKIFNSKPSVYRISNES